MSAIFSNRLKNNWQPLFAIAEDLGHGEAARAAASMLRRSAGPGDEDAAVIVLANIRSAYVTRRIDRIMSAVLLKALIEEIENGPWVEWRGSIDDQRPHKLTEVEL